MAGRLYTIESRRHVNRWDPTTQKATPGWELQARWLATQTILPVFVPDSSYGPETVDAAIRAAGTVDDQIAALGGSSGAPT